MQRGTEPPPATFRVRWPTEAGPGEWCEVIGAPRIDEGCLILKLAPERLWWLPLHTVTGPVEVEAL